MNLKPRHLILITALFALGACSGGGSDSYTLYRSGVGLPDLRIHVASFDTNQGSDEQFKTYNRDNCETAKQLFQSQPNVTVRYWCEKGAFKK